MRNFQRHNDWVAARLGDLVEAVAKGDAKRTEEIRALVLTSIPDGDDGYGTSGTDIRFHLNRAEAKLSGYRRRLAGPEEKIARMQQKLRDLSKRAIRGQNVAYEKGELNDTLKNLTILTGNDREEMSAIEAVYGFLLVEAIYRGITPMEVQTSPQLIATVAVKA